MRRFDCLAVECPLLGPHLLEASAGTGKTFSIEHVFVRLILSYDFRIEQILATTFTRAAARDLKTRIQANLEQVKVCLMQKELKWPYLEPFFDSEEAMQRISEAILSLDRIQVFTIHGFCHQMLQEFAFEAKRTFHLTHPDQEEEIPFVVQKEADCFLEEGLSLDLLCLEQIRLLTQEYGSLELLKKELFKGRSSSFFPFSSLLSSFQNALLSWKGAPIHAECLEEDFHRLSSNYKKKEGQFALQIECLARSFQGIDVSSCLELLLKEKGSLFTFLHPSNQKVAAKEITSLNYPSFFEWAQSQIFPLIQKGINKTLLFSTLQHAWNVRANDLMEEEGCLDPDTLLAHMKETLKEEVFVSKIREKYKAIIVDEFQDTDPDQWEIFQRLFLDPQHAHNTVYFVGDPKQSIYRFRKADLYTYFRAREYLGEAALYRLDTNFRSSKGLVGALNALLSREWLTLPKLQTTIPCLPVCAGTSQSFDWSDGKGALHFVQVDSEENFFEESLLPFALSEIERLRSIFPAFSSYALLVKDRYQANAALQFFQARNIPALAKSHTPIGKTAAFRAILELFQAIESIEDQTQIRLVQLGPFRSIPFKEAGSILREKGMGSFFEFLLSYPVYGIPFPDWDSDFAQIVEELLMWEGRVGFSFYNLFDFLLDLQDKEATERGRRRLESEEDAVQILTLHVSKGLEFDIVFGWGLASKTPDGEDPDELNAEKLRQFYVALTRAKYRVYVPYVNVPKKGKDGEAPPVELFKKIVMQNEKDWESFLDKLCEKESVSFETISSSVDLQIPLYPTKKVIPPIHSERLTPSFESSFLLSFSSLQKQVETEALLTPFVFQESNEYTPYTIPKGAETGVIIHRIFEEIFIKGHHFLETIVDEQIQRTGLLPWKSAIVQMVRTVLNTSLDDSSDPFCLNDLSLDAAYPEMEFCFLEAPHVFKGFIDLVFFRKEKYYIVDWKTHWLGPSFQDYQNVEEVIQSQGYCLQAGLYKEGLSRHVKQLDNCPFEAMFGGVFYFFVRAGTVYKFNSKDLEWKHKLSF